ncbi:MAG TPA: hypothetical protein VLT58_09440, partial [Polyangia bacterium]|nr:hypothetical protein [Polyangia bacterium]
MTAFLSLDSSRGCSAPAALLGIVFIGCVGGRPAAPPVVTAATAPPPSAQATPPAPAPAAFRLRLCSEAPVHLQGPPGVAQSRGCVATFTQALSDPATIRFVGANQVARRYLVYAPAKLPPRPAPVVLVFPGYSTSAEAVAFYATHTR